MSDRKIGVSAYPHRPIPLMVKMYAQILPQVNRELRHWITRAQMIPDAELRKQALASIQSKKFHCQGGSVYATGVKEREWSDALVAWIVAFQTISDYLDNLCDRSTSLDANDFRSLHMAMLDAIDLDKPLHDYYSMRTEKDDGGYLSDLVTTCRKISAGMPSFSIVQPELRTLVQWYCDLQVHKHIRHDLRESALSAWWDGNSASFPNLLWQEFAAATGSTLGVFCLMTAATKPALRSEQAQLIRTAYFPGICGLHILLDYLIDREEDLDGGDLNFCSYYDSEQQMIDRFRKIIKDARDGADRLPDASFHRMVVEGLIALYLSDKKISQSAKLRTTSYTLLKDGPLSRTFFYWNCRLVRRFF